MRKLLFFPALVLAVLLVLVFTPSVFAATNDADMGFNMDGGSWSGGIPQDVSGNGNNPSSNTGTLNSSGWIYESISYANFQNTTTYDWSPSGAFAIAAWVNISTNGEWESIATKHGPTSVSFFEHEFDLSRRDDNNFQFSMGSGGGFYCDARAPVSSHPAGSYWVVGQWNGSDCQLYVDNVLEASDTGGGSHNTNNYDVIIGSNRNRPERHLNGQIDNIYFYDHSLDATDRSILWNSSAGSAPFGSDPGAPVAGNATVQAQDNYTSASLTNFSVVWNGSTYTTTNGTVVLPVLKNTTSLWNITVSSNQSGGYHDSTYTDYNVSSNLAAVLNKLFRFYNVTYTDYNTSGGVNYTRTLNYTLTYTCASQYSAQLHRQIDGVVNNTINATCDNSTASTSRTLQAATEGLYNISFLFNASYQPTYNNEQTDNATFHQDLNAPVVANLSLDVAEGFVDPDANATLTCTDSAYPDLTYNMTLNAAQLFYGNLSNGTAQTNATSVQDGTNTLTGFCADPFSNTTETLTLTVYYQELQLIDEQENAAFNLNNVTRARVYYDDNSTFHEFTTGTGTKVNFTDLEQTKLRFEFVYEDGGIITRWTDVTLTESPLRVCINKEGVTHFEQLIISSTQQRAYLESVFSNCVVAADYTRFAYQDSYVLKAFTIPTLYSLFTYDNDGQQALLASMDGSISSFYNLDTLEFAQSQVSINIQPESMSFRKTANNTIQIYYKDTAGDNTALNLTISRLDTGATVFTTDSFMNFSEFTLYFDYSTLSNVTDNTLFQLSMDITEPAGTSTLKRYFNTSGSSGAWSAGFAAAMSFFILVFGLSFTITRSAFSWFGIFMVLIAIVFASMGTATWYIILIQVVEAILLLWIAILMYQQNTPEVA